MTRLPAFHNIFNVALLQGSAAVTPLIVFPVALREFGPDTFSLLIFVEALGLLVSAVVVYGIDVVASARYLDNMSGEQESLSLVLAVLFLRVGLWAISTSTIFMALLFYQPDIAPLFLHWSLLPLATAIQPTWYFNATRDNARVAYANMAARLVGGGVAILAAIYQSSVSVFAMAVASPLLLSAALALRWALKQIRAGFSYELMMTNCRALLRDGFNIFVSNICVYFFVSSGALALTLASATSAQISYYSIAEKISNVVKALSRPITAHFIPSTITSVSDWSGANNVSSSILVRILLPQILPSMLIAGLAGFSLFALNVVSDFDLMDFLGVRVGFEPFSSSLALLLFGIPFGVGNYVLGFVVLPTIGGSRALSKISFITALSFFPLIFLAADNFSPVAVAGVITSAEVFFFIAIVWVLSHKGRG